MLLPDVINCSAAISAHEKGMQWETALGLLQEMVDQLPLTAQVVSWSAAISSCEKGQ